MSKIFVRIFILILTVTITLVNCKSGREQLPSTDQIMVEARPVLEKEFVTTIHTSGTLQSSAATKLSFKIGGIVEKILVRESETVTKGQTLAELKMTEINGLFS